jgi:hypothetical protein
LGSNHQAKQENECSPEDTAWLSWQLCNVS